MGLSYFAAKSRRGHFIAGRLNLDITIICLDTYNRASFEILIAACLRAVLEHDADSYVTSFLQL